MTCDYARKLCSNLSSTLTSIHSAKENIFIAGISLSNEYNATAYTAIGLIGEKNTWKWLDGTAYNFTNMYYWDDQIGTPKDGFCAYMRTQAQDIYLSTWFKHEVNFRGFKQAVCKMNANL
uniref:C-type lectin domain-containing protein n=1 Tax=Panagrolaimus davidi TaxID=227884 RepID=A0A914PLI0_9BILA